jgi:hypothetical protein
VPAGPDWLHEIKYDGYRMMVIREQDRARLISRGGNDWAKHFQLIVNAALKLRRTQFVLDGEVVVLDQDGVSDFDALAFAPARQAGAVLCVRFARQQRRESARVADRAAQVKTRAGALASGRRHFLRGI